MTKRKPIMKDTIGQFVFCVCLFSLRNTCGLLSFPEDSQEKKSPELIREIWRAERSRVKKSGKKVVLLKVPIIKSAILSIKRFFVTSVF